MPDKHLMSITTIVVLVLFLFIFEFIILMHSYYAAIVHTARDEQAWM